MTPTPTSTNKRRLLFSAVTLVICYPFLKLLRYTVPHQPEIITVQANLTTTGVHSEKDFVLFDDGVHSWAVSRKCTHLGCTIGFREKEGYFECPCHSSRFSPRGEVLQGPAKQPLTTYKVERLEDSGSYLVTI